LLRKKLTYPFLLCIEDEEAAAYVGLRNFIHGLAVDRQQVQVEKNRVLVRLIYAI
jgi:hypothetical protein